MKRSIAKEGDGGSQASGVWMTTRSLTRKKQKHLQQKIQHESEEVSRLLSLPEDLRLGILKYLDERIDLPEYACVSKTCREDRNHPSFGHVVRWAELNVRGRTPVLQILTSLHRANQHGVFSTFNGISIRYIDRDERQKATIDQAQHLLSSIKLETVTHLELWAPKHPQTGLHSRVPNCIPSFLSKIIPNLQIVQFSFQASRHTATNFVSKKTLESFEWHGSRYCLHCDGRDFKKAARAQRQKRRRGGTNTFKRLFLDGCIFEGVIEEFRHPESNLKFMHHLKDAIEEISIANICCWFWDSHGRHSITAKIPQEPIMQFVREAPLLRWIRISPNVLSEDRIAILNAERPDITFVIAENE